MTATPSAAVPGPLSARPPRRSPGRLLVTIAVAVAALVWVGPLILLVLTAIRPLADFLAAGPLSLPGSLTLANFGEAWQVGQFGTA